MAALILDALASTLHRRADNMSYLLGGVPDSVYGSVVL